MTTQAPPPSTPAVPATSVPTFLAWSDPAVAGTPAGQLGAKSLLECLALVQAYVSSHSGPASRLWSSALANLPLVTATGQQEQTASDADLASLTAGAAQSIASAVGAGDSAADTVRSLVPSPTGGVAELGAEVIETSVSGANGVVTARIVQVVLTYTSVEQWLPVPHRTWTLTQVRSGYVLDFARLSDPATRTAWDRVMSGVDPSAVTSLPSYHSLDL